MTKNPGSSNQANDHRTGLTPVLRTGTYNSLQLEYQRLMRNLTVYSGKRVPQEALRNLQNANRTCNEIFVLLRTYLNETNFGIDNSTAVIRLKMQAASQALSSATEIMDRPDNQSAARYIWTFAC